MSIAIQLKKMKMNKKMSRKLNASGLTVKDKINFNGWQRGQGINSLTTRQRKRLEKKNV